MFNYIFPIFCFGVVITGIVFLGILEAGKQVKAESMKELERRTRNRESRPNSIAQRPSSGLSRPQHP